MDPRLLKNYNRELQYMREMGAEFAAEFPKIAGRLGLDNFECADPYVERLLEGFSFLAARVNLKIDASYLNFTQHLLEILYPHYLSPTPSMAVVELQPDLTEGTLNEGPVVPRNTILRSIPGKNDRTECEYRTAFNVALWPIEITHAAYMTNLNALPKIDIPFSKRAKAAIRLTLKTTTSIPFKELSLDKFIFYLLGSDDIPMRIYEQIISNSIAIVIRPPEKADIWQKVISKSSIKQVGFEEDNSMLPYTGRSFQGYRLLQEYFAFPKRFTFVEVNNIAPALSKCMGNELELILLLDRCDTVLENILDVTNFSMFSTPVINLFPKNADRINLNYKQSEFQVIADRTRPMDFEVYGVNKVMGYGTKADQLQEFFPFYYSDNFLDNTDNKAYYTIRRDPRKLSSKQRDQGARSHYVGNEVFISLVDSKEAPFSTDLRQLSMELMCTNRDLPLHMSIGKRDTDFKIISGAPVKTIRCIAGPTEPKPSFDNSEFAWRLISHLSLNYHSITDNDKNKDASSLREILKLYSDTGDLTVQKQIYGVKSVHAASVIKPLKNSGPISFARGLEISLLFDETAFEGTGVFMLGAVLERFLSKYVSINTFTETVIKTINRGEIIRWPIRAGGRQIL